MDQEKLIQERHEIYDLLSEALGPHENEAHGAPVPGIRTLMHQRDDARRMVSNAREALQGAIDREAVDAVVVFNGGNPALLCSVCRVILEYGVDPKTARARICPSGSGCGEEWD